MTKDKPEQEGIDGNVAEKLVARLVSEQHFHDSKYGTGSYTPAHYNFHPTYRIFEKLRKEIGDLRDKRVLEYGCGDGWVTAELASMKGRIDAFDISGEAVRKTTKFLERLKLAERCSVKKMAAEEVDFPDKTFDVVVGFAILHHLDLDKAMPELHRVMKPGGVAVFAEPLGSNPFLNMYRKLTPQYRTADESPLILREFNKHAKEFKMFSHEEHLLFSLLPLAASSVWGIGKLFGKLIEPLMKGDERVLKAFPPLRKFAWYSILKFVS